MLRTIFSNLEDKTFFFFPFTTTVPVLSYSWDQERLIDFFFFLQPQRLFKVLFLQKSWHILVLICLSIHSSLLLSPALLPSLLPSIPSFFPSFFSFNNYSSSKACTLSSTNSSSQKTLRISSVHHSVPGHSLMFYLVTHSATPLMEPQLAVPS